MDRPLCELIEVVTSDATDAAARLTLCDKSQGEIASFRGELRGPRCLRARTLASSFSIMGEKREEAGNVFSITMITDPCYWSPAMPFLYDMNLAVEYRDGSSQEWQHPIGLKRLVTHGSNLLREGKRVVLRGVNVEEPSPDILDTALEAEVSLLVAKPTKELMERASEVGVSLLVDIRQSKSDSESRIAALGWQAAVEGVVVDDGPLEAASSALLGQSIKSSRPEPVSSWAQFFFCELEDAEKPPAWLAAASRPVVVHQASNSIADFVAARRGCDRLQSDLSPEFDLAGYFV